ncbi:outer membrane protein [Sphingomonas adhaesiva]|uniref:outer membrane protein n=1 Tax=Sphingomonas adhaesiva TaxID=28212 RepID=UPI002FF5D9A4
MKAYLFAAGAMLAATPVLAQESVGGDPMVSKGFSGIYVGAAGGYDVQPNDGGSRILFDRNLDGRFGDSVLTATGGNAFAPGFCGGGATSANAPGATSANAPALAAGTGCRKDRDAWGYYGRIGFDHQMGGIVVGVVGEFGKTEINDSVSGFSSTPANYVMYRDISWEAGIRARAGFTPNDSTLFYGTFGPGYARINREFSSSQSTNTFTGRGDRNQFGIQGGGGIEQRIGNNFSVGLEYLYHQYQDNDYRVRVAGPAGTPFTNAANGGTVDGTDLRRSDDKFRWHSLRATAAFRF